MPIICFLSDERGAGAVEFGFIGAIIALILGGMLAAWSAVSAATDLKSAVKAGGAYVMNGGADDTQTRAITLAAWARKPQDAAVDVSRTCQCAGAVHVCTSLCSDQSVPETDVTIKASTSADGLFTQFPLQQTQIIRVR